MQEKKYGLITAITMITGVVIGAGIFFKSDDVLQYTNGSMLLGIVVFLVAAIAIIFGCLTMAQLAEKSDKPGGIIAYAKEFVNTETAGALGWFQVLFYFGTLIPIISWVTGIYICQLFRIENIIENQIIIGLIVMLVFFLLNIVSGAFGGYFQNIAMLIKLIPLILFAIIGIIYGKPIDILTSEAKDIAEVTASSNWVSAFAPIAFSYDGWIVAVSVGHKIKDSKRNLPIALICGPLLVLSCYILYFVGITSFVGKETMLEQGNESVFLAARMIFGSYGAKLILVFVVISILGTLNGLIFAFMQMPYSLALNKMIPKSEWIVKMAGKNKNMPVNSALIAFVISLFWMMIHYITQKQGGIGDISEIPVCFGYASYIVLYAVVIRLTKKGEIKNKLMGYMVPTMAIIGALIIISSTIGNPLFYVYFIGIFGILVLGYLYNKNKQKSM